MERRRRIRCSPFLAQALDHGSQPFGSGCGWRQTAQLNPESFTSSHKDLRRKTHETINKVNDDYGRRNTFNTAIAAVMELLNEVAKHSDNDAQSVAVRHEALSSAVLLLAPIAPHICHSLWPALGNTEAVADAAWPKLDEAALVRSSLSW